MRNYTEYQLKGRELTNYYIVSACILFAVGFLFYKSVFLSLLCCLLAPLLKGFYIKYRTEKLQREIADGFKDALYSIASSVACGRQMPMALKDACANAANGSITEIEFAHILDVYENSHGDIAELLGDYAQRSGSDEIRQFAASYRICLQSGGNLEEVCMKAANLIIDKLEYKEEVQSLIAQKRLEIGILSAMPPVILLFLNIVSSDYISPLYSCMGGRLIMSGCLVLIGLAIIWSSRLMSVSV